MLFYQADLDQISEDLTTTFRERAQSDPGVQAQLKERNQLPVASQRSAIMEAINDNPVVIIRGNTGCGKTTQVTNILLFLLLKIKNHNLCFWQQLQDVTN